MTWDSIPQVAAILIAAIAAISDAIRGKIYNKFALSGLAISGLWLLSLALMDMAGKPTLLSRYPELGHLGAPPTVTVAQTTPAKPPERPKFMPWEEAQDVCVWPPPPSHDPVDVESPSAGDAASAPDQQQAPVWTEPGSFPVYLLKVILNAALALLVGFGLWWVRMWAAGDAKLFATLAAMLPLSTYHKAYWPIFPAYVLLFNTFLAMLAILLVELAYRAVRQALRPTEDEAAAWRQAVTWCRSHLLELATGFIGMLFLFIVIKTLRMVARQGLIALKEGARDMVGVVPNEVLSAPLEAISYLLQSNVVVYFILLLIFHPFARWMVRNRRAAYAITGATFAFLVLVAFFPYGEMTLEHALTMSGLMLALVFGLILYQLYVNVFDYRAVRIWELRPRMILSPRTMDVLKEDKDLLERKMGKVSPDGLDAEQVKVLRRWWIDRGRGSGSPAPSPSPLPSSPGPSSRSSPAAIWSGCEPRAPAGCFVRRAGVWVWTICIW